MIKKSVWKFLAAILLLFFSASRVDCFAYQKVRNRGVSRSVTGTYKYVLNTLQVLELPDHKVRISFSGFWPNDRKPAETRNVGNFDGPFRQRFRLLRNAHQNSEVEESSMIELRSLEQTLRECGVKDSTYCFGNFGSALTSSNCFVWRSL